MKWFLVTIPLTLVFCCAVGLPASKQIETFDKLRSFTYLGMSDDGKRFFADTSRVRTWKESQEYCRKVNLRLASVTSYLQLNFLVSTDHQEVFWTSGREFRESLSEMVWDGTYTQPYYYRTFEAPIEYVWPFGTCLAMTPFNGALMKRSCSQTKAFTLCQM